jgi:hypothetical protein
VYSISTDWNFAGQRTLADRLIYECARHLNSLLDVELVLSGAAVENGSVALLLTGESVAGALLRPQVRRRQSFVRMRQRMRQG